MNICVGCNDNDNDDLMMKAMGGDEELESVQCRCSSYDAIRRVMQGDVTL